MHSLRHTGVVREPTRVAEHMGVVRELKMCVRRWRRRWFAIEIAWLRLCVSVAHEVLCR